MRATPHIHHKNAKNVRQRSGVYICFESILPSEQKQSNVETPSLKATVTREMQSRVSCGSKALQDLLTHEEGRVSPLGAGSEGAVALLQEQRMYWVLGIQREESHS